MTRREAEALDRHITGNYGEDNVPVVVDDETWENLERTFQRVVGGGEHPVKDVCDWLIGKPQRLKEMYDAVD